MLSLWDAAELDAAGEDGEVLPKFINLTDASLKMVSTTGSLRRITTPRAAPRPRIPQQMQSHAAPREGSS